MPAGYVFDSHALLKLFQKEKGHDRIIRLLRNLSRLGAAKYINAVNMGEIIYTTKRAFGDQKKLEAIANIERLNFTVLPATNDLIYQAAEYKAEYSISYADCFVLASAVRYKAVVVTGDPEFKKVSHFVEIEWV
ncbi:MAG: type II toxin-antitoxin system VapC family toxin [Nitrospirae bacterium]|nr:type II toxin-antitoxin system VapC family toxin [Nitrospirota bacterium]